MVVVCCVSCVVCRSLCVVCCVSFVVLLLVAGCLFCGVISVSVCCWWFVVCNVLFVVVLFVWMLIVI